MKLHLPKALLIAIIAASGWQGMTAYAEEVQLNNQHLTWSESTSDYEGDIVRLTNGTTIKMTGGEITMDKLRVHDLKTDTTETFTLTDGTLNIIDADTGSGTGVRAVTLGHWGNGTGELIMNGGTLNVTNGTVRMGYDSNSVFSINGGTANIKAIEYCPNDKNSHTVNLTGGRLNIGSGGITNTYNKATRSLNLVGGTLGLLETNGAQISNISTYVGNITIDTNVVGTTTGANISLLGQLQKSSEADTATIKVSGSGSLTLNQTFIGALIKEDNATAALKIVSFNELAHTNDTYTGYKGNENSGYLTTDYVVVDGTTNFDTATVAGTEYNITEGKIRIESTRFFLNGTTFEYSADTMQDSAAQASSYEVLNGGKLKISATMPNTLTDGVTLKNNGTLEIATQTPGITGGISITEGTANIKLTGSSVTLYTNAVNMANNTGVNYIVDDAATLKIAQEALGSAIKSITMSNGAMVDIAHAFASLGTEAEKVQITMSGNSVLGLTNGNTWGPRNLWADILVVDNAKIGGSHNGNNSTVRGTIKGSGTLELIEKLSTNSYTIASTISDNTDGQLSVKVSSGRVKIDNAANTYSGGTTLAGGTLTTNGAKALGNGTFTVTGGSLTLASDLTVASYVNEYDTDYMDLDSHTLTVDGVVSGSQKLQVKNGTFVVKGNLTLSEANLALVKNGDTGANVHLYGKDNKVKVLDLSNGGNSAGIVTLKKDSSTKITNGVNADAGALWMNSSSHIILEENATLSWGEVKVTGTEAAEASKISTTADQNLYLDSDKATIANAKVEVKANSNQDINLLLKNSSLINNGTGTISTKNAENTLTSLAAKLGDINLMNIANSVTLNDLSISEDMTVGVYASESTSTENERTLSVKGTATFGSGATLNANLVLDEDTKLTMNGALTMGSTLTLGKNIVLDASTLNTINALTLDGARYVLFKSVDELTLGDDTYTTLDPGEVQMNEYFKGVIDTIYLGYDINGDVFAATVPEPTTATLSLLALAGLAARRRRK